MKNAAASGCYPGLNFVEFFNSTFTQADCGSEVFHQFIQGTPVAIIMTDRNDVIRIFNPAAERLLGYQAAELVGKFTPAIFHDPSELREKSFPRSRDLPPAEVSFSQARQSLEQQFPVNQEWTYIHKDGVRIPVLLNLDVIRDAVGEAQGYVAYANDISGLRTVESEKADAVGRIKKIAAQLPGVVYQYFLAPDGTASFPYVSEGCLEVFGIPAAEAMAGRDMLHSLVHADDVEWLMKSVQESASRMTPWTVEFRVLAPGRGERWIAANSAPEKPPGGGTLWHGFLTDITEKKRVEATLIDQNDILQILANTASDFINLPLDDVEPAIQRALEDVAHRVEADRAYIFEYDFNRQICRNSFEWCGEGILPEIQNLQEVSIWGAQGAVKLHIRGESFIEEDVPGLPDGPMRRLLHPQDIKSIITIPLMNQNQCEGFVGFDFVRRHHQFQARETNLLQFFSKMLSGIRIRREAQEGLEQSEQRFRDMTDAAGEYVWEVDVAGRYLFVSERAEEVLGRPVSQILGRRPFDFMPPEDAERAESIFRTAASKAEPFSSLRHRSVFPDGRIIYLVVNGRPFFNADGVLQGYRGLGLDVTQEENSRLELDRVRQEFEVFFDVSINLLCIVDLEGRFRRVSQAWKELLGQSLESIEGARVFDFLHPEDLAGTTVQFENVLRGEMVAGFVNRYRSANGGWTYLEWRARLVNGLIYCAAHDVSQKLEEERALQASLQSEKETAEIKGRLISMASHEFRTPLATIQMAAEMLEAYWPKMTREAIAQRLGLITATTGELTTIITEVLDFSILEAGTDRELPESVEVVSFTREIANEFFSIRAKNHKLHFYSERRGFELPVLLRLYKHVLVNLLENAVKYSPPGSRIDVGLSWSPMGSRVRVEVRDRGVGVPRDARTKIWDPFFRAKNIGTVRGTGLGLSIAKQAVTTMGGRIGCKTMGKGRGSLFFFTVPVNHLKFRRKSKPNKR